MQLIGCFTSVFLPAGDFDAMEHFKRTHQFRENWKKKKKESRQPLLFPPEH